MSNEISKLHDPTWNVVVASLDMCVAGLWPYHAFLRTECAPWRYFPRDIPGCEPHELWNVW